MQNASSDISILSTFPFRPKLRTTSDQLLAEIYWSPVQFRLFGYPWRFEPLVLWHTTEKAIGRWFEPSLCTYICSDVYLITKLTNHVHVSVKNFFTVMATLA